MLLSIICDFMHVILSIICDFMHVILSIICDFKYIMMKYQNIICFDLISTHSHISTHWVLSGLVTI